MAATVQLLFDLHYIPLLLHLGRTQRLQQLTVLLLTALLPLPILYLINNQRVCLPRNLIQHRPLVIKDFRKDFFKGVFHRLFDYFRINSLFFALIIVVYEGLLLAIADSFVDFYVLTEPY